MFLEVLLFSARERQDRSAHNIATGSPKSDWNRGRNKESKSENVRKKQECLITEHRNGCHKDKLQHSVQVDDIWMGIL